MDFERAVRFVIQDEGGYVDHRFDKGGETKFGISSRSYPNLDIKNLTVEDAAKIYRQDFWDRIGVERLPAHLRYQYFDIAVNSGPRTANILLQRAAGVRDDGVIGPATLRAITGLKNVDLLEARLNFFANLVRNNSNQIHFFRGWISRAMKVFKRCEDS